MVTTIGGSVLGLVLLSGWQLFVTFQPEMQFWVSSPGLVYERALLMIRDGELLKHTVTTLQELVSGFTIGALLGTVSGYVLARWTLIDRVVFPYLMFLYAIPKIALAPVLIIFLGIGLMHKVVMVVLLVYFTILINTYAGVKSVNSDVILVVRLLGGNDQQVALKSVVPAVVPWVFAGMRIAIAFGLGGAIVGEMMGANAGIGYLISYSAGIFDTTGVYVGLMVLGLIGMVATEGAAYAERRLLKWHIESRLVTI